MASSTRPSQLVQHVLAASPRVTKSVADHIFGAFTQITIEFGTRGRRRIQGLVPVIKARWVQPLSGITIILGCIVSRLRSADSLVDSC